MAAGFKDEAPRFDPVWMRSLFISEVGTTFDAHVDESAIHISDSLDITRVLQGMVEPFENDSGTFYTDFSFGLVYMSCSDGAELVQQRVRSQQLTFWRDCDVGTQLADLERFKELNLLTPGHAADDSLFIHMLGRTIFSRAQAIRSLEHFRRLPIILGELLGPRLSI